MAADFSAVDHSALFKPAPQNDGPVVTGFDGPQPTQFGGAGILERAGRHGARQGVEGRREVMALPARRSLTGDVEVHRVAALAGPVPDLVHDAAASDILIESWTVKGGALPHQSVVIANRGEHDAARVQLTRGAAGRLPQIVLRRQVREGVVGNQNGIERAPRERRRGRASRRCRTGWRDFARRFRRWSGRWRFRLERFRLDPSR